MSDVRTLAISELFATIADVTVRAAPAAADGVEAALERVVSELTLDSRQVERGALYLALPGRASHGLDHLSDALSRGAAAVAAAPACWASHPDAAAAVTAAGAIALEATALPSSVAALADRFFGSPDRALELVAVTGTDGKTSVCRFIADAFAALGVPAGYIGTLGWGLADSDSPLSASALTTPDAVALRRQLRRLVDAGATVVAFEASSHGLAEGRLEGLAIDLAVLTNLRRDHLDYHGSEAAYAAAKSRLFDWPGLSGRVLNADDRFGRELLTRGGAPATGFTMRGDQHAVTGADTTLRASALTMHSDGWSADIHVASDGGGELAGRLESSLLGAFNVQNLLACLGVLRRSGVAFEAALTALSGLAPVAGRMERVALPDGEALPTVLVDYAHTPAALEAALAAVRAHCRGALWVVFGCGGDRDRGKRAPMARAAETAEHVVITDDNPRTESSADILAMIVDGLATPDAATVIADRGAAIGHAVAQAAASDVILIAGKGHEDYQLVGERRLSFSDRDVARDALAQRVAATRTPLARGETA